MIPEPNSALIVVDVQEDFVIGSLAVPGASQILPYINNYIEQFDHVGQVVVYTKDFHKKKHPSFKEFGGIWPAHCVEGTRGADFATGLDRNSNPFRSVVILKGYDVEAYSGFQEKGMKLFLKYQNITDVYVCGIATDYCVKATALDALKAGYKVHLLTNACAGVDPTTTGQSIAEMREAGVDIV